MIDVSGISGAAPIWHDSMLLAEQGHPMRNFTNPGGLVRATVTYPDGVKTTDLFMPGTVPTFVKAPTPNSTTGEGHTPIAISRPGGNPSQPLPNAYCPASYSYAFPPPPDNEVAVDASWW
jgi:membrane carboxypeptidase/penicillin-binding protein